VLHHNNHENIINVLHHNNHEIIIKHHKECHIIVVSIRLGTSLSTCKSL